MSRPILSAKQLEQARRYIQACGSSKNPISLLMEVGQQLFQAPKFELFEANESSVHQHVFTCRVIFFNYDVEVTGFNKKKIKTEAACCMIEKIKKGSGMDLQTQNKRQSTHRSIVSMPEQKPSPTVDTVFRSARSSNTKKPIDFSSPLQKSTLDWQRPHTTSPPPKEKSQIVNSRLGVRALNHHLEQLGLVANQQSSTDDISNDIFENSQQSTSSCARTALERLKTVSQQEKIDIVFHDLESDGNPHLCLLEAKLKLNFVCHGIGENQPQARENAAENLLFVIDFFKGKPSK